MSLHDIGVKRGHHDLWIRIIQAALDRHADQVSLDWLRRVAAGGHAYTASSPALLAWLRKWNAAKPYHEQIRPFGFLLAYMPRAGLFAAISGAAVVASPKRGRPRTAPDPKPIAPYHSDPKIALMNVFDRVTGRPVAIDALKTYAEVLAQYHLSPEAKFLQRRIPRSSPDGKASHSGDGVCPDRRRGQSSWRKWGSRSDPHSGCRLSSRKVINVRSRFLSSDCRYW